MTQGKGAWNAKIISGVKAGREELIELVCSLIRAPSENPPGDQTQVMGVVKDYLRVNGLSFEAPSLKPGVENVMAPLGPLEGRRSLILYGHTDVVPAGDPKRWAFPPFAGDVWEGFIRGRGATDMKAGTGAALFVTCLLHRLEAPLDGPLVFHANPDEEDFRPEEKLLHKLLDDGRLRGTACIMGEPSGLTDIGIGDKGDLWLRLRSLGRPAHGSSPMLGDSAVDAMVEAIRRIRAAVSGAVEAPDDVRPLLGASRAAVRRRVRAMGIPDRAAAASRMVDHTTVNVGTIRGGTMINMVPDDCLAEVALCLPAGISSASLLDSITRAVGPLAKVEVTGTSEPNYTRPDDPIVQSVRRASKKILGRAAKPVYDTATSDAQLFRPRGIPTLFYGPGDLGLAHALDEKVSVEETLSTAKIFSLATVDYLGLSA